MAIDQLNTDVLGPYLEANIAGFRGLQSATKFARGQSNPTFLLTADSGHYVLRRQPPGTLLRSAHAVDREFRVIHALRETGVPVPRAYHLCEDPGVIGSLFYVMGYIEGRIFWNPALPELEPSERAGIYDEANRVLAILHDVDYKKVGLGDYGHPGNFFERQISLWIRQYRASETGTIEAMDRLIEWLPANLPEDDGKVSLIHGDYRLENIIIHPTEARAVALLDWELSTLGHPFADLAHQCLQLRLDQDAVIAGLGDCDRTALGIPSEEAYLASYCKRRGLAGISHWNFYMVFSFFRIAAILQGVLKRAIDGNASSQRAFEYGALAPKLAKMAVDLTEQN